MKKIWLYVCLMLLACACRQKPLKVVITGAIQPTGNGKAACCVQVVPARFSAVSQYISPGGKATITGHAGMVWIPGGTFYMGAADAAGAPDEYPRHKVTVSGFWMDATEVTNRQFARFVLATGYVTTAERKPDWNELKKQLPEGTPKPDDKLLVPASLVFAPSHTAVNLGDNSRWWKWQPGASWRHPQGPGSSLKGKADYPVVQVSYYDALAYCKWAHKRLPAEAQWELSARGGLKDKLYPWGNQPVDSGRQKGNFWQGHFPDHNSMADKYYGLAPVASFPANGYGLFDMAGNVWEWCADLYHYQYYSQVNHTAGISNPAGPLKSLDPDEPYSSKRVVRGGSFLCNGSYCAGYRVSRRMKETEDSSAENVGFRCVED